jgi:hypothetical protein
VGVTKTNSTLSGGLTPICSDCGIALCWDIFDQDYAEMSEFWDEWRCNVCYPFYKKDRVYE